MKSFSKLVISIGILSLFANCSSNSDDSVVAKSADQQTMINLIENTYPIDFPKGTVSAGWSDEQSAFVVSSNKSGCSVLVKDNKKPTIDSEVACSY